MTDNQLYTRPHALITGRLLEDRKIFLWDMVNDATSRAVVEQMAYLDVLQPGTPIQLFINSPGGMVTSGFTIYDMMQAIASPVHTYCIGFAASMASVLLSSGEKGHRYIYPRAEVMIHQPSVGSFQGNSADIEINARQIVKTKELVAELLAANCRQTKQRVMEDFDRDHWMNAEEALSYGIADRLMTR